VATHHHPDHVGGVDVIARELGLPIWAHADTATQLRDGLVSRRLVDGDAIDLEGPTPERWTVLHTPGHAWGHVCLWDEDARALVIGDMASTLSTILIAPGDGDMGIYLEQLARLSALDAHVALPAHGPPIDAPSALFQRYIEHRLLRERKALGALPASTGAPLSIDNVLAVAYDDTPMHLWPIARLSLASHLAKLSREGRAVERDGKWCRGGER
jgi:glyoxylase-like metal-dependent hydrolase (beta-lactamase superfamily II)